MSSSTTTTMMITMLMSMTLSRRCTSSSACRRFSCSTVSVLFSASLFQQLLRASFYARRDLAAEGRDPQPFLLKYTMLMDPIGSSLSAATYSFCVLLFVASSLRSFVLVVGVVRANALRQSAVTTEMTAFQFHSCCSLVREHHPVQLLSYSSSLSLLFLFYFLLLFLSLR